jgi:hypothetical protein
MDEVDRKRPWRTFNVRLEDGVVQQLDELVEAYSDKPGHAINTRADVIRAAIGTALDAITLWQSFDVRITDKQVAQLDALVPRFNTELHLTTFGHVYTRADILRAVINNGIRATLDQLGDPPPEKPTSQED